MNQQIKNMPAIQETQEIWVRNLYIVYAFSNIRFFAAKAKNF